MTLSKLTYLILKLNSALDTGAYDDLSLAEASHYIETGNVVYWLRQRIPEMDLSILGAEDVVDYHEGLLDIYGGYAGQERRKWGVEKRGLCLLIAWTNEMIARRNWVDS